MSIGWHCPTMLMVGCDGLSVWLADRAAGPVTVLADAAVADGEIVSLVRGQIAKAGLKDEVLELTGAGDLTGVTALAARLSDTGLVVGVGGGSLLDQAKLATLLRANPAARARLEVAQRSGLTALPHTVGRSVPLVAIPTTVGTGAELSPVACLNHGGGKRLICGTAMQPDLAVVDPVATATLPVELLAEGVLEVLFRVTGLYVGGHRDLPTEDALAEAMAESIVRHGKDLRSTRAEGRRPSDWLRTEIAKLSGLSHAGWAVLGREPYSCRGWYVANELSSVTGVRKMTAVAALLPPLWRSITDGDTRWGSARRLRALWQRLRAADSGVLPEDPGQGVAALIDSWGVGRRIDVAATADGAGSRVVDDVVRRSVRAWGAGLPMLNGFSTADIRKLVDRAVAPQDPKNSEYLAAQARNSDE
ncbi:daptide-type RiPP biosynthesis dehydogenase [Streptomyces sp. NPDC057474]|uniref:daptide-type RiPP biosynthesis dehydogenase n=1 Tax=Streptomyces sp. NPDC057474 TaxID=3346144 RepID=UPI00367E7349